MKKVLLSLAVIAASGGYVTIENANSQANGGVGLGVALANVQSGVSTSTSPAQTPPVTTQPAATQSPVPVAPVTPTVTATVADTSQSRQPATPVQTATATQSPPTPAPPLPRSRPANAPTSNSVQVAQASGPNGTFRGPSVNAYYGRVQVAAVLKSGHLASIEILQHPYDRGRSQYISSVALPMLEQEAIQAQSANINIVSGATLTSEAFIRSLSGALSPARG